MQPPFLLRLRSHFSRIHSANPIIFRVVLLGDLISFNFCAGKVRENQTGVKINGNKISTVRPRLPRKYKGFFVTLYYCMQDKSIDICGETKIPSLPFPRPYIGSLSVLEPVYDSWRNDIVAQLISGSTTEGKMYMSCQLERKFERLADVR